MVVAQLVTNYFSPRNALQRAAARPGRQNDIAPGLVPTKLFGFNLNGGLYATPDTPADPTDCARYPDSPFCGGNPITPFFASPLPDIINTECDKGFRLNLSLGFIRLPPVAIVYRRPKCRNVATVEPDIEADYVLFPDSNCSFPNYSSTLFYPYRFEYVIDYYHDDANRSLFNKSGIPPGRAYKKFIREITLSRFEVYTKVFPNFNGQINNLRVVADVTLSIKESHECSDTYMQLAKGYTGGSVITLAANKIDYIVRTFSVSTAVSEYVYNTIPHRPYGSGFNIFEQDDFEASQLEQEPTRIYTEGEIYLTATVNAARVLANKRNERSGRTSYREDFNPNAGYEEQSTNYNIAVKCSGFQPPPPPNDPCIMNPCCPCDDTLLKLLNKKLDKLTAILGGNIWTDVGKTVILDADVETQIKAKGTKIFGDDFSKNETVKITNLIDYILNIVAVNYHRSGLHKLPAEMPQRLIYPNGTGKEHLTDLMDVMGFQVKQVDRAVGYLPQKIKVADTNPGLAGNQSIEVEIHSFADFAKEILQYIIDTEGDSDTTNNMLVRCLYELGFIHQGVVQGDAMLDAIVDHMDFKHRWKKVGIPFAFDPYAGQKGKVGQGFDKQQNNIDAKTEEAVENLLPKLLTNTEVDVRILVNDEKKSLNDLLQDIKRDTAVAAAAVAEKSTPERLEQLVRAAQLMLQIQSTIDRRNMREALVAGNLKTRRVKK